MKLFKHFKLVDEKIFNLVTDLKSNEQYSQFNQKILSLEDSVQNIIKNILFFTIMFSPIVITAIIYFKISMQNDIISSKKQIISLSDTHAKLERNIKSFSNGLISNEQINSEEDVKNLVSSNPLVSGILPRIGFDNFSQTPLSGNLKESTLTLKFSEISTGDLSNLMKFAYQSFKSRLAFVSITRNDQSKLLMGELTLTIISN